MTYQVIFYLPTPGGEKIFFPPSEIIEEKEKEKSNTTPVRVELTILRLTVARLNQLGHGVVVFTILTDIYKSINFKAHYSFHSSLHAFV